MRSYGILHDGMIADVDVSIHTVDRCGVADDRAGEFRPYDGRSDAADGVAQLRSLDGRTLTDRYVGTDRRRLERNVALDIDRVVDRHAGRHGRRPLRSSLLQDRAIRLEHRALLAGVVPPFDVDHLNLGAVVDHVLEGVGEVV